MKTRVCTAALGLWIASTVWSASGINYDGTSLELNNEFTRTECGTMAKKTMKETSGMACSRTTAGYLWAHGDENLDENRRLVAIKPDGTLTMTLNINSGSSDRDDWEDIATGIYGGKNYVFLGAIGDNELEYKDQYYIYFFEEPAIASGTQTMNVSYIRFGYPDGKAHNTETLMYDNVEQMLYIVDKVEGNPCALFKLPFKTDYGTNLQTLTKVCDLGTGSAFELCCGGDITPDGKWMAIKNQKYVLLWERQGSESLSETAKRRPVQVAAYKKEEQGESLAWADSDTFYTTSDSKKDTPIYKYVRGGGSSTPEDPDPTDPTDPEETVIDSTLKEIHEVILSNSYSAYINEGETIIRGWYLAGQTAPTVKSYLLSEGATWLQTDNNVTVTPLKGTADTYTMEIKAVMPVAFTDKEMVLDGSEGSWIKSAYGWDSTKKWKFSKTDDDYSREIAGKTHVELFLPACDTVILKAGGNNERNVRFYINGVEFGSKTKFVKAGVTLAVKQDAPFMLTIASAQSSGDGGLASIRMVGNAHSGEMPDDPNPEDPDPTDPTDPTDPDPEDIESPSLQGRSGEATKVIRDGQLYLMYNGKIYNVQGSRSY